MAAPVLHELKHSNMFHPLILIHKKVIIVINSKKFVWF